VPWFGSFSPLVGGGAIGPNARECPGLASFLGRFYLGEVDRGPYLRFAASDSIVAGGPVFGIPASAFQVSGIRRLCGVDIGHQSQWYHVLVAPKQRQALLLLLAKYVRHDQLFLVQPLRTKTNP